MPNKQPTQPMTEPAAHIRFAPLSLLTLGFVALCGCGGEPIWKSQSFAFASPTDSPAAGSNTNVVAMRRVNISPLYQCRSFTYRTAENIYEHDSYAGFFVPPEQALEQPIRAWLRVGGAFGRIIEPKSGLNPSLEVEVTVNELYGDLRKAGHPMGVMEIHFMLYQLNQDGPGAAF